MKAKVKSVIVATAAVVVGYIVSNPLVFRACRNTYEFNGQIGCSDSSIKTIGAPLLSFSLWALLVAVVAFFLPEKLFKSWLKFAVWAVPVSLIFIFLVPDSNPGALMDILPFYRDDAARLAGGVLTVLSLILITWKYFSLRKTNSQKV